MPTDARLGVSLGVVLTLLFGLVLAAKPAETDSATSKLRQFCKTVLTLANQHVPKLVPNPAESAN